MGLLRRPEGLAQKGFLPENDDIEGKEPARVCRATFEVDRKKIEAYGRFCERNSVRENPNERIMDGYSCSVPAAASRYAGTFSNIWIAFGRACRMSTIQA